MQRALAFEWLERAIEDRQVFAFQARRDFRSVGVDDILDRVERIDMGNNAFDPLRIITEFLQRRLDRLIDNLEHAATGQQLVFYQCNVGFDSGCVAIHQETDRARRREHRYLCVAIAMALPKFSRALPNFRSFFFQMRKLFRLRDFAHCTAMQLNHVQHRSDVVFRDGFRHAARPRVAITGEWSHSPCHSRALLVRFAGHDRSDRAAERPALDAIVTVTITHDQRAEVRVAKPECAENMRVLRDFSDRVTCVINDDLLCSDEDAHRRFESLHIKIALRGFEFH